jgi:hypothetical protein
LSTSTRSGSLVFFFGRYWLAKQYAACVSSLLLAFLCPIRQLMSVNRALKAAQAPCALFAAAQRPEAKRHQPQLSAASASSPPAARGAACASRRLAALAPAALALSLRVRIGVCSGLHGPGSNKQGVDTAAHTYTSPPFSSAFVPWRCCFDEAL